MFEPKELDQATLSRMQTEVKEKIITARIGLLLKHPWFGNMATRLTVQSADDWCPTAATDGRHLYFNTQFFNSMSLKELEFVIAHEILHCAFEHMMRTEKRDRMLYNIACDYVVNNVLVRDRIGEKPNGIKIFVSSHYAGWSSEEVYDDLYENAEKISISDVGELLDEHLGWGEGSNESNSTNGRPVLSKEEMDELRNEIRENMISAAQAVGIGNTPLEIRRLINDLTESKMNWREILQQQIQSMVRIDYTFSRPSRRSGNTGAILPGTQRENALSVAIALDMSGSITNSQVRDFLSELQGIMDQYTDYVIDVWCFDTQVYAHETFRTDDGEDMTKYQATGGGGTDIGCNWEYMKNNDIMPQKLLVFTDMYSHTFGDPLYCDTIFINHGRPDFHAPFGMTIFYE